MPGIVHAVVLLLILLLFMPLAQYIPMACLAGVLAVVAYNMSGWRTFRALLRNPRSDVAVLLLTFFLTVVFDLTIAIEVGLLIACVLFMKRVMETTEISVIRDEIDPSAGLDMHLHEEPLAVPKGVEVYEINGPYFFGIATRFEELMPRSATVPAGADHPLQQGAVHRLHGYPQPHDALRDVPPEQDYGGALGRQGRCPRGARTFGHLLPAGRGECLPRHPRRIGTAAELVAEPEK